MVSITKALKLNETHMIYSIDNDSLSYKKYEKLYLIHFFGTESRATILPCLYDSAKALWDLFARKNLILFWKSLKVLKVFEHSKYEFIHHPDHYKNRFPAPGLRESSLRVYRGGEHTMTPTEKLARRLSPSDVLTLSNNFLCVTKWFTLQVLQHVSRCLD